MDIWILNDFSNLIMKFTLTFSILMLYSAITYSQNNRTDYYINKNKDTISCTFIKYKKKESYKEFLDLIIQDSIGDQSRLNPEDILSYYRNGQLFIVQKSENAERVFIKVLEKGRMELYEALDANDYSNSILYLKYSNQSIYYLYSPENGGLFSSQITNQPKSSSEINALVTKNIDESFKSNINKVFGDCVSLRNKIQSGL